MLYETKLHEGQAAFLFREKSVLGVMERPRRFSTKPKIGCFHLTMSVKF